MANMKAILAILVMAALILPAKAQDTHNPDLTCFMDFSQVGGSGECRYYETHPDAFFGLTNFLDFYIQLPGPPDDAWILERKNNGAFSPVTQITNIFGDGSSGYVSQIILLNTRQVRSLAKGDLYAEVDFGGSNYLSNLAPQYQSANGPAAAIDFLTPVYQQYYNYAFAVFIAGNNRSAMVKIDASGSLDPLYLPKRYSWLVYEGDYGSAPTILSRNSGSVVTYIFRPGVHSLVLQVDDAFTEGRLLFFNVKVITAAQAVDSIIEEIEYLQLPEKTTRALVRTLSNASTFFERGNLSQGCAELKSFIRQVKPLHFLGIVDEVTSKSAARIIAVLGFPIESEVISP